MARVKAVASPGKLKESPPTAGARLKVAVLVHGTSGYGRAVLRGVTRFANLQRHWLISQSLAAGDIAINRQTYFDGLILAGSPANESKRFIARASHVVVCSGSADPATAPVVTIDNLAVGRLAAEHFLRGGLRRCAYLGSAARWGSVSANRLAGLSEVLVASGVTCDVFQIAAQPAEMASHSHRQAIRSWIERLPKPVGIFCVDDNIAHLVAEICLEAGIVVPEQVAILGVNNDDLMCESAYPPLSSIDADFVRVGFTAAELLDQLLRGKEPRGENRLIALPPVGVVQRQSTTGVSVQDGNVASAIRYIREHACDPCDVAAVLQSVAVGRRWLERQFIKILHRGVYQEIARVRIATASRLLRETRMPVPEIASRCGYSDLKGFYRSFLKLQKSTPARYRRDG